MWLRDELAAPPSPEVNQLACPPAKSGTPKQMPDSRWTAALQDPAEKQAFFDLFDEYLSLRTGANPAVPTSWSPPPAASSPRAPPRTSPTKPSFTPPTPVPTVSPSSRLSNFSNSAQNSLASSALKNQAATSGALRGAGFSPRVANAASSFGAQHSEQLAPHLVAAAKSQAASSSGGGAGPGARGPKPPAGLQAGKSIAGGFSTDSGRSFTRSLLQSKGTGPLLCLYGACRVLMWRFRTGPMSKEEAKKNTFKEPLAVSRPTNSRTNTPPARGPVPAPPNHPEQGLGRAQALYDYAGEACLLFVTLQCAGCADD